MICTHVYVFYITYFNLARGPISEPTDVAFGSTRLALWQKAFYCSSESPQELKSNSNRTIRSIQLAQPASLRLQTFWGHRKTAVPTNDLLLALLYSSKLSPQMSCNKRAQNLILNSPRAYLYLRLGINSNNPVQTPLPSAPQLGGTKNSRRYLAFEFPYSASTKNF